MTPYPIILFPYSTESSMNSMEKVYLDLANSLLLSEYDSHDHYMNEIFHLKSMINIIIIMTV